MILAELNGKIPSKLNGKEDILTSNVFSFLKYSNRQYLKDYLYGLGIKVSLKESENAEFIFWPKYEDGTEPDLVILCGDYYLLFEAKLYSDFSSGTDDVGSQIEREIVMGKRAANHVDKEFVYVAITAEYYKDKKKYLEYENREFRFLWTNWQFFSRFIEEKIYSENLEQNKEFAIDLFSLLVKNRLRSFEGIRNIIFENSIEFEDAIFYNLNTSKFKGIFTGFVENLQSFEVIPQYGKIFKKSYFSGLALGEIANNQVIFYNGK